MAGQFLRAVGSVAGLLPLAVVGGGGRWATATGRGKLGRRGRGSDYERGKQIIFGIKPWGMGFCLLTLKIGRAHV